MLSLFIFGTIGVTLRFLFMWAFDPAFRLQQSFKEVVVCEAIMLLAAYVGSSANVTGWVVDASYVAGGFLTKYIVEKLNKIKG